MGRVAGAIERLADGELRPVTDMEDAFSHGTTAIAELQYDYSPALLPGPEDRGAGMWRFNGLLPLETRGIQYPLPVGGTPLIGSPVLRSRLGTPHLWLKDESRAPTTSNKDRATALVLEHGLRSGIRTATAASTGNVAVSLAIGAAAAGMRAVIFVPASVNPAKLALMLLTGALIVKVRLGYEAAFRLSRAAAKRYSWLDRNTGVNPLTIEAKKTVAFEIWEQLDHSLPDVVLAPVGDGPTLLALGKGFRELLACGATHRVPRLLGVQAAGCEPLTTAWESGGEIEPVEPSTIADGIAVGNPVAGRLTLREVKESGGAFLSVNDGALLAAIGELAAGGVLAEPAGAASYAGLRTALSHGLVSPDERLVVLITGSILKTPQFARPIGQTIEVEGEVEELTSVLPPSDFPA